MGKRERSHGFTKLLKVGEVSKQTSFSISTLHYYEKIGLIQTPLRSRKGYRLYGHNDLGRLDFIKKAKTLGFKLDEIRQFIDESKLGDCPFDSVRNTVDKRLREVNEKIEEMKRFRNELTKVVSGWDEGKSSDAVICSLIEQSNIDI